MFLECCTEIAYLHFRPNKNSQHKKSTVHFLMKTILIVFCVLKALKCVPNIMNSGIFVQVLGSKDEGQLRTLHFLRFDVIL